MKPIVWACMSLVFVWFEEPIVWVSIILFCFGWFNVSFIHAQPFIHAHLFWVIEHNNVAEQLFLDLTQQHLFIINITELFVFACLAGCVRKHASTACTQGLHMCCIHELFGDNSSIHVYHCTQCSAGNILSISHCQVDILCLHMMKVPLS